MAVEARTVAVRSQRGGISEVRYRIPIPTATGRTTIQVAFQARGPTATSTRVSARRGSQKARMRGQLRVASVVMATDKMRSPLNNRVMTFEAIAPGMQPTRTIPT